MVTMRKVCALPSNPSARPSVAGDPVEDLLAEVPERRVPQVVGERRGLDDVGVAAAQRVEQAVSCGSAPDPLGDRPGHLRHLQAVGEPVVQQPGAAGLTTWVTPAEPGEERRGGDPVAVDPERAGRQAGPVSGNPGRRPARNAVDRSPAPSGAS